MLTGGIIERAIAVGGKIVTVSLRGKSDVVRQIFVGVEVYVSVSSSACS